MIRLAPGVDPAAFRPGSGRLGRSANGTAIDPDRPVVVCVSRMVARKGQDTLIRAWPRVLARCAPRPGTPLLLLVGDGPYRSRLERLAARLGVAGAVLFTGPVSWDDLPSYYDAGNIFAMPCRTRRAGLDVEGLGIVYLEASATGLPVVGGDSGGAPDAIIDGETGYVVPGRSPARRQPDRSTCWPTRPGAAAMGEKGQAWIEREWTWDLVAERLQRILSGLRSGLRAAPQLYRASMSAAKSLATRAASPSATA